MGASDLSLLGDPEWRVLTDAFGQRVLPTARDADLLLEYDELHLVASEDPRSVASDHFRGTPNCIAHLRVSKMRDVEGNPLLLIHEAQAQWPARVRADQALQERDATPFAHEWVACVCKAAMAAAVRLYDVDVVGWLGGDTARVQHMDAKHTRLETVYDRMIPKAMQRILRRHAACFETVEIPVTDPAWQARHEPESGAFHAYRAGQPIGSACHSLEAAIALAQSKGAETSIRVQAVRLDPAVRDIVLYGPAASFGRVDYC